jgi:hypothetical protein
VVLTFSWGYLIYYGRCYYYFFAFRSSLARRKSYSRHLESLEIDNGELKLSWPTAPGREGGREGGAEWLVAKREEGGRKPRKFPKSSS